MKKMWLVPNPDRPGTWLGIWESDFAEVDRVKGVAKLVRGGGAIHSGMNGKSVPVRTVSRQELAEANNMDVKDVPYEVQIYSHS